MHSPVIPLLLGLLLAPPAAFPQIDIALPEVQPNLALGSGQTFTINTFAGNGGSGFSGDGGPATSAQISLPKALAVDPAGNVYILTGNRVRKVTAATGAITTIAGNGVSAYTADGSLAVDAALNDPQGIAVDANGVLYISEPVRVRRVSNGFISTIAGNGSVGSAGDGGPATSASLWGPQGLAFGPDGSLYIADASAQRVRRISAGTITTVAGNGLFGSSGDGGSPTNARLATPRAVAVDANGAVYIVEANGARIRRVSGGTISTFAGNGSFGFSGDGGPATSAQISAAYGIAVDGAGDVYFNDGTRVRRVSEGIVNTIAGSDVFGFSGDGGPATAAAMSTLWGVALNPANGNILVSDSANHRVRQLSTAVNVSLTPFTGSGATQTFSAAVQSQLGLADIIWVQFLVNTSLNAAGACWLHYERPTNRVWLFDDAAGVWLGPQVLGTGGTLSITRCTLNQSGSSASASANTVSLNLALEFSHLFGGDKRIYAQAYSAGGFSTGWQWLGRWTVPGGAFNQPPYAESVAPSSGSGASQLFTLRYSDLNLWPDISSLQVLFGSPQTPANSCWIFYDRAGNGLWLMNDAGNRWSGPMRPGMFSHLQNSQCTLYGVNAEVAAADNQTLQLKLPVTFHSRYAGSRAINMFALDSTGLSSGWVSRGTWTVANQNPTAVSVTPNAGAGPGQLFSFRYSDGDGNADIQWTQAIFNSTFSAFNSCWIHYETLTNRVWLMNDGANQWIGPLPLGTAGVLQNSQCALNVLTSSVARSGNELTWNLDMAFLTPGTRTIYSQVQDNANGTSGWVIRGLWSTVQPPPAPPR